MTIARFLQLLAGLALASVAAGASPDAEKTRQLLTILQSDAGLHERARACQQLTIVGSAEAVPTLAALLSDPRLGHYSREALEAMPYPEAGDALLAALGTLKGDALVGVVNSIGMRRDAKAVGALARLHADPASGESTAALLALGRIASTEAIRFLQQTLANGPDGLRAPAAEGCLIAAESEIAAGNRAAAIALYDAVRGTPVPEQLRVSAARGAIVTRGSAGLSLLSEQLHSGNAELRDVALLTIRELPGNDVVPRIVSELAHVTPAVQALLVTALGDRGDARGLGAIEACAKSDSAEVRSAALRELGRMGGDSSFPILLRALASANAGESEIALASLSRIPAPEADAFLLKSLATDDQGLAVKLIGVIGKRNSTGATPELLKLAQNADADIAKAALRALAMVAGPPDLPGLIAFALAVHDDALKTLADRAVVLTSMKVPEVEQRPAAVLAAFRQASDADTKISLLRPLGAIVRSMGQSHEAFFVVRVALIDGAEALREAALRTLAAWPDATPVRTLLDVATDTKTSPEQRDVAFRGAIRLATSVADGRDRAPLDVMAFFSEANRIARTKDEQLMVVSGLAKVKHIEALRLLQPYLDNPEMRSEAASAVLHIAPALAAAGHTELVNGVVEKITALEVDGATRRQAEEFMKSDPTQVPQSNVAPPPVHANPADTGNRVTSLFNGRDLEGWEGNPGVWRVRDGTIVGGTLEGNPRNEFLATRGFYRNYILRLDYKLVGTEGFVNGGVQFRSVRIPQPPNEMSGYQADIGANHSGSLYDESRRKKFLARATDEQIKRLEKPGDWNRYEIRCEGPHIELRLNGETTLEFTELDDAIPREGLIALQIHGKCKAEILFRRMEIEELP